MTRCSPTSKPRPKVRPKEKVHPSTMIKIKPLSVNQAWHGRRFKTDDYKNYEQAVSILLPANIWIPDGPLLAIYEFGLSNFGGDWDNPVKPLQDILQKKYRFNDSRIHKAIVTKTKVRKGEEFVALRFERYQPLAQA